MARLRFPGRPGYRFDRIGVRYSADEARQTTDPTLAIVAGIHKGLQRFRDIFGDSDEDDIEFVGFTPAEVRAAEKNLQQAIKQEKHLREQQAQKQKNRFERSKATLASLAAAGLELAKNTHGAPVNLRKTYKRIVETGLVKDATDNLKQKHQHPVAEVAAATGKQNGQPVPEKVSNLKHIKLKRLSHNVDTQPVFRRPVGRPRKYNTILDGVSEPQKGCSFESIVAASTVFGTKPISKYTSVARQILARATKQAVHTSGKLLTSTHKVRKFVLPTKSSRSSRVIKPNKRFLEDDSVHQLVAKQPKMCPMSPTSISTFKTPIFGMGVSVDKSNSFSAFQSCGLSLSPFNLNREKGFPVFSAAPQPSGTSSFMDGLTSQKPLGSLDQPLIVEGKRPRKPSLIMRMKLVEDDPADEIRLQQQLSDASGTGKPSSTTPDGQKPPADSKFSSPMLPSQTKCFGVTKSLIAPAKLFTDSSTCSLSSKSFKHQQSAHSIPSQSTVVLRQAKFQLNRIALNRSKAALARSLKAQLKREAKLERKKRTSQNRFGRLSVSAPSAVSPGSSLSQLSPFSKLASDSAIERQKSGLFEGIEAGAGSFSPGSFGSPPVTPSSLPTPKLERHKAESYQASLIKEETLQANYPPGSKWRCLVCLSLCIIKKNRKLPQVPLCRSCKKSYFFQLVPKRGAVSKRKCKFGGTCNIHFSQKSQLHCVSCKFSKFEAIIQKCRDLGVESYKTQRDEREALAQQRTRSGESSSTDTKDLVKVKKQVDDSVDIKEEPHSPVKKQRHRSEEMATPESRRNKQKRGESDGVTPARQRQKHKSGDKISELTALRASAKSPSHSKELINASNLDKPLSVDVGQDTDPFSLSPPQTLSSTKSSPDKNSRSPSKKFSLTSNGSDRMSENEEGDDGGRSRGSSRGPRIKHVCRRAAMVFPQQRATFPEEPQKRTLTLSALPNEEKQQLWAKSKQEKAKDSSTEDSSDEKPLSKMAGVASPDKKLLSPKDEKQTETRKERKIGLSADKKLAPHKEEKTDELRESRVSRNKTPTEAKAAAVGHKMKKKSLSQEKEKLRLAIRRRGYTRKIRCRECKGCKTPECGVCVFCRDKPKFGGPGKIKKCCIHSVCLAPKIPRKATQAFIEPKSPTKTYRRDDDDQNGDHHTRSHSSGTGFRDSSSRYQDKRANSHWRMDGSGDGAKDDGEVDTDGGAEDMDTFHQNGLISGPSSIPNGLDMDGSRYRSKTNSNDKVVRYAKGKYSPSVEATIQLALTDVRNPFIGRMAESFVGRRKHNEKKQLLVELKPVQNETAYSFDVPLKTHLIRADYEEDYNVETAWPHGFSLTLTGPTCVRTLCYLCGSAGKHEMLYCIVCCQPYHSFCLDEDERPEDGDNEEVGDDCVDDSNHHHSNISSNTISWCCRRCQFCHVCGHQNGLLKCHRCKDTYHPECLGPNYPTRPSHKNIWVCTKCVRCKSCGATTPGVGTNATWTYDFSLCYECGKLMDKGNFCPICHKCYSDDDWESKMVQCAVCESWVHARCEELTDEMYQLVSFLPEEVQYTCRVCSTDSPPYWERVLKSELVNGLLNVLSALMGSKCAQMLLESGPPRDTKKPKQIKRKTLDWTKVQDDDSSNNENTQSDSLNSSTDTADSPQDMSNSSFTSATDTEQAQEEHSQVTADKMGEQTVSRSAESINSSYTKHLLTRHEEEIIERCDCETVQPPRDIQTAASYRDSSGINLLFSEKLPNVDSADDSNSFMRIEDMHTSNANVNVTSLKCTTRKTIASSASCGMLNGDADLHANTDGKKDVMDLILDILSKEENGGDITNSKITSTTDRDVKCPQDIHATAYSQCDNGNTSDAILDVSTPSCETLSASSTPNFLSVSSLCAQDFTDTQPACTQPSSKSTSPFCKATTTIPPASFYPNASRESVTKNLFLNHHSLPESGLKCAFGVNIDNRSSVSANSETGDISPDSFSKCVEYMQPKYLNNESNVLNQQNEVSDKLPQQQAVPLLTASSVAFRLDMITNQMSKEKEEKTPEKREIAYPNTTSCLHVSFGNTILETLNQNGEFPRDFGSIKLKIDSGFYSTVEEFSEDMVRIIQSLLFENEQYTTRKKQANSVRSIFIKQMERFFPWFNVNTCKLWEHNRRLPAGMLRDAVLPPSSDHIYAQWLERKNSPMSPQPSPFKRVSSPQKRISGDGDSSEVCITEKAQHHFVQSEDTRACLLCQQFGDDVPDCAGRLLYCGQDDWIHINCALWSAEVYEQDDGSLQNVLEAVSRGKKLRCNICQLPGATVGCCEANCRANYHFMCARADRCAFQEDKTIFCKQHTDGVNMNVVKDGHFDISSRVCVNLDKIRSKSSWGKAVDPVTLNIIIGSCTVERLGVLYSSLSDTEECLYPVDFRCTRIYWSTQDARRRCVYTCRIVKVEPDMDSPGLQIQDLRVIHDENHPEFVPLNQLNLENLGIPNFMKPNSKSCGLAGEPCDEIDDVVYMGSDQVTVSMTSVSYSSQSVSVYTSTHLSNTATVLSESIGKVRLQSFEQLHNQILPSEDPEHCFIVDEDDPHGVSKSWPVKSPKQKPKAAEPKPIDLSGLSPSTLALLSIKNPSRYILPSPRPEASRSNGSTASGTQDLTIREEDLGLLKIADRLNSAASGRPRHVDSDRGILNSPMLSSPLQPYNQFRMQTQHGKCQSLSPVRFSPKMRPRSNSEGRHENSLMPLSSPGAIRTFSTSFPVPSHPHPDGRARSESPLIVIRPQDMTPHAFRSVSLSPPPLTVKSDCTFQVKAASLSSSSTQYSSHPQDSADNFRMEIDGVCKDRASKSGSVTPIVEVSESEDEEQMVIEDANKKSSNDQNLQFENVQENGECIQRPKPTSPDRGQVEEIFNESGLNFESTNVAAELSSDILSTENIKSILESVPPEVLEGEDIKVIIVPDLEGLTEDDIMRLASAAMLESAGDQATGSGDVGTGKSCNKVVEDSDGQQGEEPTHDGRDDGASSDQGDQGNTNNSTIIDGDQEATDTGGGGDATNNEDGVKGSDHVEGTSENTHLNSGHISYCHSGTTGVSSVPTPSSSGNRGTQKGNDEDDDLSKPHKEDKNNKNKDVIFHDVEEIQENDSETMDTSSDGQSELVRHSEISTKGQDQDRNILSKPQCDSQSETVGCTNNSSQRDVGAIISGHLEVSTESNSSNSRINSCSGFVSQVDDSTSVSHASVKGHLLTSVFENTKVDTSTKTSSSCEPAEARTSRTSKCASLVFSEEGSTPKEGENADSNIQMLTSTDQSFIEMSEDDVKIIDLSDSEKAVRLGHVNVISSRSGPEVSKATEVKSAEIGRGNAGDRASVSGNIQRGVESSMIDDCSNQRSNSLRRAQVSGLAHSGKSTVRSGQIRSKAGLSTQDTTTDEESDYLMLDDFSYSETNDEDDCNDRRNKTAEESSQPTLPDVILEKTQPPSDELSQSTRCDAVNKQETHRSRQEPHRQQSVNNSAVIRRVKQVNLKENLETSQTSLLPSTQKEDCEESLSQKTDTVVGPSNPSQFADNDNSEDSTLVGHQCSVVKVVENITDMSHCEQHIKLKPCFVSLRREDARSQESVPSLRAGSSGRCSPEVKRMQLRVRKMLTSELKTGISDKSSSHCLLIDCGQKGELKVVNSGATSVMKNIDNAKGHELLKSCDSRSDKCEQVKDHVLLKSQDGELKDEQTTELESQGDELIAGHRDRFESQENELKDEQRKDNITAESTGEKEEDLKARKRADTEPKEQNTMCFDFRDQELAYNVTAKNAEGSEPVKFACSVTDVVALVLDDHVISTDCLISSKVSNDISVPSGFEMERMESESNESRGHRNQEHISLPTNTFDACEERSTDISILTCQQANLKELIPKEDQMNKHDISQGKRNVDIGPSVTSSPAYLIPNIQDDCIDEDTKIPEVAEKEHENLAGREKLMMKYENKVMLNFSKIKAKEGREDSKNSEIDKNVENSEIDKTVENKSGCSVDLDSSRKVESFSPLSTSKSYEDVINLDSDEDEKELVQIDHTLSVPPDYRSAKSEDKHFFYSTIPSEHSDRMGSGSDDNLHERIVEKIKAESLARSSPGEEGPFKCPTCKRMYRTRESYEFHVRDCDFEVSTSDEEDRPIVKELCSSKRYGTANEDGKQRVSSDVEKLKSLSSSPSPLNEPLTIIIADEYKDEKYSPSSRDLSDDCSSVQSQDSRRSSLRKSTVTQRNAAPAHLAKVRLRDSKLSVSPDGSTCSSLLSPKSSTSRAEDKPSPKEAMLEAVGLVSRRSLELSPNSDIDGLGCAGAHNKTLRLQPRVSPTAMAVTPKREKRSPGHACVGGITRPSILAGGLPKPGSSHVKSIAITYDPVILEEVKLEPLKPKRPRQKRIWWIEASECPEGADEEKEAIQDEREDEDSDEEEGVASRTRQKVTTELKSPTLKKGTPGKTRCKTDDHNSQIDESMTTKSDEPDTHKSDISSDIKDQDKSNSDSEMNKSPRRSSSKSSAGVADNIEDVVSVNPQLPKLCSRRRLSLIKDARKEKTVEVSEENANPETEFCGESRNIDQEKQLADEVGDKYPEQQSTSNEHHMSSNEVSVPEGFVLSKRNLRSTRSKERVEKTDEDNSHGLSNHLHQSEDPLMSPLRRSRRPPSKTAKLSEYLTELKKENEAILKEETYSQKKGEKEAILTEDTHSQKKEKEAILTEDTHSQKKEKEAILTEDTHSQKKGEKEAILKEETHSQRREKEAILTEETRSLKEVHTLSSSCDTESHTSDIPMKRGRGRPRIYPEKERPKLNDRRSRGRLLLNSKIDTIDYEELSVFNLTDSTCDRPLLDTGTDSKYSHMIQDGSSSSVRDDGIGNDNEMNILTTETQFQNEVASMSKQRTSADGVEDVGSELVSDQVSHEDESSIEKKTANSDTGVRTRFISERQNELSESQKANKCTANESLHRENRECIDLSDQALVAVSTNNSTESKTIESNTDSSQKSQAFHASDKITETTKVGIHKENSKSPPSVSANFLEGVIQKEVDPNSGPPFSVLAADKLRPLGQKLRIIIRSPNVIAAQTIGELIKKTALSVNPNALDITVTTKDSSISRERECAAERGCPPDKISFSTDEKPVMSYEDSHKDGVGADTHVTTEDARSKDETPMVSRSVSPDSISAAYDIQSDDFSSETSNDMDDFTPSIPHNVDVIPPHVSGSSTMDVTSHQQSASNMTAWVDRCKLRSNVYNVNDDDDDDVVIVKAVGLQPPEPGLALKASQTPYSVINHQHTKLPISSTHSQPYSSAPPINSNTPSNVAVTACGRILSASPVVQQSGTISHISQQSLAASPTRQSIHSYMNLHHQTSTQQNQPSVMISEVSPGRYILQQQPSARQEYLTSQDISQSGLLLQNSVQPGIIIQAQNQSGISLHNPTQSGIIFRHANPTGLMLPPTLQGQQPILQSTGQGGLSFISLNPSNPLAPTIISPIQPLQSHVNPSSMLPTGMGLTPLMQAATLSSQTMMISQPFLAQPGMFLPQLSTQSIVSQHSEQIDMARRHQQHQQPHHLQHQHQNANSVKPSSIIIDPHAHMLTSGLNQTVLKANMQQYSPLSQRPVSTSSNLDQKLALPSVSTIHSHPSSSPALFSPPATSCSFASQTLKTYPSSSTIAPILNLQKMTMVAPKLTKVDGAPAQVNYMGSFDLNSSALQSVMSAGQSFNQDASKRIMELVQSALKNQGKEQIPGVEVTTAITNTPQGPKKVLRVFINEDILPSGKAPASAGAATTEIPSLGAPVFSTTSSAMASLLSLGQASNAAASQTGVDSEWTKLLPSSSQLPKSQQQFQNLWSASNSGYVSIPINQNLSANSRSTSSSQSPGSSRFLPSAQFRRALKPAVYSHHLKRKHAPSTSTASDKPQAKRPVFEKMLKSDGVFSGTLQQIVERNAYISDNSNQSMVSGHPTSEFSKPEESGYSTTNFLSNQTKPSSSFIHHPDQDTAAAGSLTAEDYLRLPTTVTDDSPTISALQESQHFTNHLQHHTYHHIVQQQQQQLQRSPHKRASFPLMSPIKKPQAVVAVSQSVSGRARIQILQKSILKKDILQKGVKEARTQLTEKRKSGVRSKRLKTAVVASHHPLIHHKKGADSLPQPTLEEEVIATPLDLGKGEHPHGTGAKGERERSESRLRFEITSDDGFSCQGDTVEDAWNQVLEKVQDVRAASRMKQLSYAGISGRSMFGLDHEAIVYLVEQLYGAVHCHRNYKFRFHKYDLDQADEEVALNPSGAARSETFFGRKPFDMFNFLKSVYRTKPGDDEREKEEEMALKSSRRATSLSLPMAMRFRKLKTFAKEAVDVYRSKIHGRGLFCKRNIDAGEMVIEYAGEVIRASLTDKREKYYEGKGIGCYMFRIDDDEVVDATMHGSAARFINHSCEPNCFSKVILVDGKKHIVIFAMRPIKRGEELTYDYKFPIEEVKIPCSCGSKRCRKYLN